MKIKICSWNVNGFRAACSKDFYKFLKDEQPDILCLQETKLNSDSHFANIFLHNYNVVTNHAERKGYAGTAILSTPKSIAEEKNIAIERFDKEGRFIKLDFGNLSIINVYMPHGRRDKKDIAYKIKSYKKLINYIGNTSTENIILIGDFNVAHDIIDLANYKHNNNNTMFTLQERSLLDKIIGKGYIDVFRYFHPEERQYTWWPYAFEAKERNMGWRIDYIFVPKGLIDCVEDVSIEKKYNASDHCPLLISINIPEHPTE